MTENQENEQVGTQSINRLARVMLVSFLFTFILTRTIVFLIMARTIPDWYFYIKGTHIHHLNYGIFLLAGVGAYLIFAQPKERKLRLAAGIYGVAMALTFDEFGMWIHLGGSYWQRASWDAVVVISAVLGLIAYSPSLKRFRPHHWITAIILTLVLVVFFVLFVRSFHYAGEKLGPKLHQIESAAPK